jgi:hypothetical protein
MKTSEPLVLTEAHLIAEGKYLLGIGAVPPDADSQVAFLVDTDSGRVLRRYEMPGLNFVSDTGSGCPLMSTCDETRRIYLTYLGSPSPIFPFTFWPGSVVSVGFVRGDKWIVIIKPNEYLIADSRKGNVIFSAETRNVVSGAVGGRTIAIGHDDSVDLYLVRPGTAKSGGNR